jgi:hypothetical protein
MTFFILFNLAEKFQRSKILPKKFQLWREKYIDRQKNKITVNKEHLQKQIELVECFKNGVDRESCLLANEQKARDGLGVVLNNSFQPMIDIVKELTAAQNIDLDVSANAKNFLEAMANGLPEEAEATKQFLLNEADKLNKKDLVQKINDIAKLMLCNFKINL